MRGDVFQCRSEGSIILGCMSIWVCNYEYRILYLMFVFLIMYCFCFLFAIVNKKRLYQVPAVLTAVDDCSPQFAQCGNVQAWHIVMSLSSLRSPVCLNSARSFSWRLFKREREREGESKKGGKKGWSSVLVSLFFVHVLIYVCVFVIK